MKLRDYQRRAVDQVKAVLHRRPILVAPTGAGKTVMGATLVKELDVPTLWLAHRRELIQQAAQRLYYLGVPSGVILSGYGEARWRKVQVASVQTLARRIPPKAGLIVIDECHHARAESYLKLLERYRGVPVVGLTATPFRLDGKGLGDIFGEIVVAAWPDELVENGTLVEPIVYAPDDPDLSRARIQAGDFTQRDMMAAVGSRKIVGNIVQTWLKLARGKRTVCFAVNVEHSRRIVEEFRRAGVPAEHLDGTTPKDERDAILARLRSGETQVVSNCMVLTEGWDLPALEVAILARPTASLCLHLQTVGRIMRAAPDKAGAIVLDHAGNHLRHGLVTQRLTYSLADQVPPRKTAEPGKAPVKRCPGCFVVVPSGARVCPECGHEFRAEVPEVAGGELVQFAPRAKATFAERKVYWDQLEERRLLLGFKPGWSAYRYRARFGEWPDVVEINGRRVLVDPKTAPDHVKRAFWERLERTRKEKGYKPGWTAYRFRAAFGHWPRWRSAS